MQPTIQKSNFSFTKLITHLAGLCFIIAAVAAGLDRYAAAKKEEERFNATQANIKTIADVANLSARQLNAHEGRIKALELRLANGEWERVTADHREMMQRVQGALQSNLEAMHQLEQENLQLKEQIEKGK